MAAAEGLTDNVFDLEHVAQHNKPEDAWIIVRGKGRFLKSRRFGLSLTASNLVYNVTNYFDDHPGGRNVLMEVAGSDATEDFEYTDHSDDALRTMEGLLVGTLIGGDKVRSLLEPF